MKKRIFPLLMTLSLAGLLPGCFYSLGVGSGGFSAGGGGYHEGRGGERGDYERSGRDRGSGYERRGGAPGGGESR